MTLLLRLVRSIGLLIGITLVVFLVAQEFEDPPRWEEIWTSKDKHDEYRERLGDRLGVNSPWYIQYLHWMLGDWITVYDRTWYEFLLPNGTLIWLYDDQVDVDEETGYGRVYEQTFYTDEPGPDAWLNSYVFPRTPLQLVSQRQISYQGIGKGVLRGDFGNSYRYHRPVSEVLQEFTPQTLELMATALITSVMLSVLVVSLLPLRVWEYLRMLITSAPVFWIGLVLVLVFAFWLDWLPRCCSQPLPPYLGAPDPSIWERMPHFVLPTLTLALAPLPIIVNTLHKARGKRLGLLRGIVSLKDHGTVILIVLLAGVILTEEVFSWPGVGRLMIASAMTVDRALCMTIVVLLSSWVIIADLVFGPGRGQSVGPDRGRRIPSLSSARTPAKPWRILRSRDRFMQGIIAMLMVLGGLFLIAPGPISALLDVDHTIIDPSMRWLPIGSEGYLLGTDGLGRDFVSVLLHGGQTTLIIALASGVLAVVVGTVIGAIAGGSRTLVSVVFAWVIDSLAVIPPILLLILLSIVYWEPDTTALILIIGIAGTVQQARSVHDSLLPDTQDNRETIGLQDVFRSLAPLIPNFLATMVAAGILWEAGLGFLGLSVESPTLTWGNILTQWRNGLRFPHLVLLPGVFILIPVLCLRLFSTKISESNEPSQSAETEQTP